MYYPHIRLDDDQQLLDMHNRTPSQGADGEWYLNYWGRDTVAAVLNPDIYPGVRETDLVFPAQMVEFFPDLQIEIDGVRCFAWRTVEVNTLEEAKNIVRG